MTHGEHSSARAQADRPLLARLKALAAEQAEPILRDMLVRTTADNVHDSLMEELRALVTVLDEPPEALPDAAAVARPADYHAAAQLARADLRAALEVELHSGAHRHDSGSAADLAREFASSFWSAMLEHMRSHADPTGIPAGFLLDALRGTGVSSAALSDVGAEYGLNDAELARAGRHILGAVADDGVLHALSGQSAEIHFPFGLRVDRSGLKAEVERHMFDGLSLARVTRDLDALAGASWDTTSR